MSVIKDVAWKREEKIMLYEAYSNYSQLSISLDDRRKVKMFKWVQSYWTTKKGIATNTFCKRLYKDMFQWEEQEAIPLFASANMLPNFLCAQKLYNNIVCAH